MSKIKYKVIKTDLRMKTIIFTFCSLFFEANSYAQQYNFVQLIEMTNDRKAYEINMIKALNQMYKKDNRITYSYTTSDGVIGSSDKEPTNDSQYEPKYRFDNGIIYTQSEIEVQKLDESFEIRNRLRKDGNLINANMVDSFSFKKGKITSLIKGETTTIGFAENYHKEESTASTWYNWERKYFKILLPGSKLFSPNYKKLTVQYVRDEDFSTILSQIIASAKYIETKEEFGSFISSYRYLEYSITTERFESGHGGYVSIYIEE